MLNDIIECKFSIMLYWLLLKMGSPKVMLNYPPPPFWKFHYLPFWRQRTMFLFLLNKNLIYYFDASLSIINNLGTSKCSWRRNGLKSGICHHNIVTYNTWHSVLNTIYKKLINYTYKNIIFALFADVWIIDMSNKSRLILRIIYEAQ
jgi:hypothetical protein